METKPAQNIETEKKAYVAPTLEKRDQLVEVVEAPLLISGVAIM